MEAEREEGAKETRLPNRQRAASLEATVTARRGGGVQAVEN
jgi:hypothetical protein